MAPLALHHVGKTYPGDVHAVDDLTLDVADGELLVLFGASGCGKTTTLRLIAGLERLSRGSVSIDGRVVDGLAPRRRDVAMVFQHYALYPHLSVEANLGFALKVRRTPRAEIGRRVRDAAELLGIADLLARRPSDLSGGQRQRVALGRAIVRRPRIFLFDEPLSHLDAALRVPLRREIRRLHARLGTTTVYVTHDQAEAMTLGQRIAVLRAGRLQQVAEPATLYQRPANRFVAGLIGTPAMSFLEGRIVRGEDRLVFDADDFVLPLPDSVKHRVEPYAGRPITLGIRPEHLSLTADGERSGAPRIRAAVEAVEPVGAESHVYLTAGRHTLVSRAAAGRTFRVGATVEPAVVIEQAHFFDGETENAL